MNNYLGDFDDGDLLEYGTYNHEGMLVILVARVMMVSRKRIGTTN